MIMNTRLLMKFVLTTAFVLFQFVVQAKDVFVNNKKLDNNTVYTLEQFYKTKITGGYYWYDNMSGYWGYMGSPAQGKLVAGLRLGGQLPQDASNGNTGVFVNGRELSQSEVNQIKRTYGRVYRGRFWLNAKGLAGFEGQPAIFNFAQMTQNPDKKSFTTPSLFGTIGGNGECFYYNHPGGNSISNCD
jgi:hypothetical protein